MKVGAERKKVILLGGLLVVAVVLYIINSRDDSPPPASRPGATRTIPASDLTLPPPETRSSTAQISTASRDDRRAPNREFKPSLKQGEKSRPDPGSIDPTLRLDLLAKLQAVSIQGGDRNLFQFGAAPPPKIQAPTIVPNKPGAKGVQAQTQPSGQPVAPVKPPPPPIPLKFYGYASQKMPGVKRAFFLDGDDIVLAGEGETIKRRYKVIRIGVNSALVEDTDVKNQQSLPLEEVAG
jgi:hypothetical protein